MPESPVDNDVMVYSSALGAWEAINEVSFQVTNTGAQDNITADGNPQTIVLDDEVFDNGGNFATNTFTAPTNGNYQLSVAVVLTNLDNAATEIRIGIQTSNRNYIAPTDPRQFAADVAGRWFYNISILADMESSDTAIVFFTQDAGSAQTDIPSGQAKFSGFLQK